MHGLETIKHINKQAHKQAMKRIAQDRKAAAKLVRKSKRGAA